MPFLHSYISNLLPVNLIRCKMCSQYFPCQCQLLGLPFFFYFCRLVVALNCEITLLFPLKCCYKRGYVCGLLKQTILASVKIATIGSKYFQPGHPYICKFSPLHCSMWSGIILFSDQGSHSAPPLLDQSLAVSCRSTVTLTMGLIVPDTTSPRLAYSQELPYAGRGQVASSRTGR